MLLTLFLLLVLLIFGWWYGIVLHKGHITTNTMIKLPRKMSQFFGSRSGEGYVSYQGLLLQIISVIVTGVMSLKTIGLISGQVANNYLLWSIGVLLSATILLSILKKW